MERKGERFWLRHVRGWRDSGLTQVQYCERHRIALSSLRYWSGRARKGADVLKLVPTQVLPEKAAQGCVVRSAKGWEVEFKGEPTAGYLRELLRGVR